MMQTIISWFREHLFPESSAAEGEQPPSGVRVRPPSERPRAVAQAGRPEAPDAELRFEASPGGRVEEAGPGKNVLMRNKYLREDTGTHEVLKIIDETILEDDDGHGIDPYNTGQFDRSRNWSSRSRK